MLLQSHFLWFQQFDWLKKYLRLLKRSSSFRHCLTLTFEENVLDRTWIHLNITITAGSLFCNVHRLTTVYAFVMKKWKKVNTVEFAYNDFSYDDAFSSVPAEILSFTFIQVWLCFYIWLYFKFGYKFGYTVTSPIEMLFVGPAEYFVRLC